MNIKAFTSACLLGAVLANKYQTFSRDHHLREQSYNAPALPENNVWDEYWASNETFAFTSVAKCLACTATMDGIDSLLEVGFVHKGILGIAALVCEIGSTLGHRFTVCPELVTQFGDPLFTVFEDYLFTRDRICNERLGLCQSPVITELDLNTVVDNILATKPESLKNDDFIQNMYDQMAKSTEERPTLRAMHLSDVHLDFEYLPGSLASCKDYLCCRADSGKVKPGDTVAGDWGTPLCDIPVQTFQSMLDYIVKDDSLVPDMIFWTGDNSAHNVWDNTAEESVAYTVKVSQMIKDTFDDKDVTIMPIQGNHDTWVEEIESFAAPGINYEINHFKYMWQDWLTEEAYEKFGEYGYYSMPIELLNKKTMPAGSRVIAYNTQACNSLNWYTWGQREDPGHMFAWLEQELLEVEAQEGLAFLISHYTPQQCQHQFGTRYRALMERFQNVVRFTMHGHTHQTYYEVVQSMSNPGVPIMLANVGGSVTTYTRQNPSFMMIDFDQETMLPVNMYTYWMDIERANAEGYPTWELLHDYKTEYGLTDLSPKSMLDLSTRMLTDTSLATLFDWNMHVHQGEQPTTANQVDLYCMTRSCEMHEMHECQESQGTTSGSSYGSDYDMWTLQGFADWMIGDWINISIDNSSPSQ